MSLGGNFQKHFSAIAQIVQFSGYFVVFPTGQASVHLCLCHYGHVRISTALSDLTDVSWELLFQRHRGDASLRAPRAGSQPPWPLEQPCVPCSSNQLTWSEGCSSKPQPCPASFLAATEAHAPYPQAFIQLLLGCWWNCPWCFQC